MMTDSIVDIFEIIYIKKSDINFSIVLATNIDLLIKFFKETLAIKWLL